MNPNELFADIKLIKEQLAQLNGRPAPATAEQVESLTKRKVNATIESAQVAQLLKTHLGDPHALKLAADAAAEQIRLTGQQTAQQIEVAGARIPRHIDVKGSVFGFTSWSSMGAFLGTFFVICASLGWYSRSQSEEVEQLQHQLAQTRDTLSQHRQLVNWLQTRPAYRKAVQQFNQQR